MKKSFVVSGVIFILLISLFQLVFAQNTEEPDMQESLEAALDSMRPEDELIHLRGVNQRTFKKKDGKRVTFISTEPLNYITEDVQLEPIDTNLTSELEGKKVRSLNIVGKDESKYQYHALKNSLKSWFAHGSDGGVKLEYDRKSVEFILEHERKSEAVIDNNRIKYEKVFPNCDLVYTVLPGQVKDELIFHSTPQTPIISYRMKMNEKLSPQNGPDGSVKLVDQAGKAVFQLLHAFMYEKDNPDVSKAVETKFHWNQNELYCDLILDLSWLKNKSRQYPIVVDPVVTPAPTSSGRDSHRTLIHCPETRGSIKCEIDLKGPHWHGDFSKHYRAEVYFRDKKTGQNLLYYHGTGDYNRKYEGGFIGGHNYEVYLKGGETKRIDGKRYTGHALATIEYGEDGSIFSNKPAGEHFTGINNQILLKRVFIEYPQRIKYKYVRESANSQSSSVLTPYFRISPGPSFPPPGSHGTEGEILLNKGHYVFELSPSTQHHYRVEIKFPLGTSAYEKKIVLRTNPGAIESTFMAPSSGDVCLQYHTIRNNLPSSNKAYPHIKLTSGAKSIFQRNFSLDTYDIYDGGDKVHLDQEKLYTLTVSRGRCAGGGWGGVNLDFFYPENKPCSVNSIQMIDQNGNPVEGEHAALDYGLQFEYHDDDNHSLKAYTVYLGDEEYPIDDVNDGNGWITMPYRISDFGLYSGTTFQSIIKAYDGFDLSESGLSNFTVDGAPPVIDGFTGEVTMEDDVNCLNLVCQAEDVLSGIQKGVISWKVQDQTGGTIPWSAEKNSYSIPDLPANAEVEVTFSVTDNVGNIASLTKVFHTYPETADLAAPVAIHTSNPGRYHPTLKFTKTEAPEYRIQRYLLQDSQTEILEYDTGYMDADTLSTVSLLPPGLNIISPANDSVFGRPAHITLTAFTDQDCEVYKVDFYANDQLIDSVTGSPFRILWRNVRPGIYKLNAVATDTDGLTQTSPEVVIEVTNEKPEVRIVRPISGDSFSQPAFIYIRVEATDNDGDITKVEFFNGEDLIDTDTSNPYSTEWKDVPYGDYTLTARATDSDGATSISDPVNIHVTNERPTVSIIKPSDKDVVFIEGDSITIEAEANDNDGSIDRVEFYANDKLIGTDSSSPYIYTWKNASRSRHAIKVKTVDNDGGEAQSGTRYVDVIETPDNKWYGRMVTYTGRKKFLIPGSSGQYTYLYTGKWVDKPVKDNINNSGNQSFFYEDSYKRLYFNYSRYIVPQATFSTYYWVPRDVTVTNYARHDDALIVSLNGVKVFENTKWTGNKINKSRPIKLDLKGKQWNQVNMYVDNREGSDFELTLEKNFKYLIQQALSDGETVYMSSRTGTGGASMGFDVGVGGNWFAESTQGLHTRHATSPDGAGEGANLNLLNESNTPTTQEYYSYIDLLPVDPHQTYVYRITTRNGDQSVSQDSEPIPVMNNPPEISGVEPNRDTASHSNGAFSIRVTDAVDYDGDPIRYYFEITGPATRTSSDPKAREFVVENLPDGEYAWTVRAEDDFGGTDTVGGTILVNKETPTALFSLNDGALYTVDPRVRLVVSEATETVEKIRISNDQITWTEYAGSNQTIEWDLGTEDGRKAVYLQAYKPTGEIWGPVVERSITLDRTEPDLSNLRISARGGEGKVTFNWLGGRDATSGLSGKVQIQRWENGAWAAYESNYAKNRIEIPAEGFNAPVKIRLQLEDNAGNISAWSEPAEGYTKAAPGSFELLGSTSGYSDIYGHYIALRLNPADGAEKYLIECVQNPGGGDTAFVTDELFYRDQAVLPHQTYKYRVLTYNSSGEISEGPVAEFTVANTPPVKPVGTAPCGLLKQGDGIVFSFDQPMEVLDPNGDPLAVTYLLSSDGDEYTELATNIPTNLQEGITYWWKAMLDDGYDGGVVTTDPVSFVIDQTAPVITVDNHSTEYALEHQVRINVSDSGSGIETLFINGAQTSDLNSELTFNVHGAHHLVVEAHDRAGNAATFSHTYYVDREPPSCTDLSFDLPKANGRYLANNNVIPLVWQAGDAETGVENFKYNWSGAPGEQQEFSLLGEEGTYANNILGEFIDGETYYLQLQAVNHLGLSSAVAQSPPLFYDHTGPALSIEPLKSGNLFNGIRYLKSIAELRPTVNADDPHSGISKLEYALVESPTTDPETQWFESLADLGEVLEITEGKAYYLAVRATNGTLLTNTVFSAPIIIDGSEPELIIHSRPEQKDGQAYMARVEVTDPETTVVKAEYGIGTETGGTDLSKGLPGADMNGWLTIDYPETDLELRQYAEIPVGITYFITVKATNSSGVTAVKTSSGTKVIPGNSPVVRDDGTYTSDTTNLHFEWGYPTPARPIEDYRYRIRSEDEATILDWRPALGADSVLAQGLDLTNNTRYYCDVQAVYDDGSVSEVGSSDGILVDTTAPEITGFGLPKYAAGDGIDLTWAAEDPESGVKCYVGIGIVPGATDVSVGWIYLGNARNFRLSQDTAGEPIEYEHKHKYYVTIMVQNGAGLAVQQTGAPVLVDLTPPDPPVVIDEGIYTNRNDQLKFSWKWPLGDEESGIREYWYALTTQQSISGGEEWYTSYEEKETLIDGLELMQGAVYYLAVKAVNNTGAETVGFSDGILVDVTAPTPPTVVDFGDYSLSSTALDVSMVASDAESGVAGYTLSLGTIDDPQAVIKEQSVLGDGCEEHLRLEHLNLTEGEIYYFTATAINHAGGVSMLSSSDGIMVDSTPPVIQSVNAQGRYLTDPTRLVFDWTMAPTPSGIIDAQYAVSEDPNGTELAWQSADLSGSQILTGLNLEEGKTYYLFVRAQNRALAENTPTVWSNSKRSDPFSIDTTPPEILNIHTPALMPQRFLLQWEARDDVSGIAEYRYAVGSYRQGTDLTGGWRSISAQQTTVSFYLDDLPLQNSHDCYISVMAKNGAGLWSPVYTSAPVKTELTPPAVTEFSYRSSYINCNDLEKGIHIDWAADDPESGMAAYRVCFVTDQNKQDLDGAPVLLTNQTSGVIHLTDFDLVDGGRYYLAFQAQNSLGAWSEIAYSGEILVDLTPPVVSIVKEVEEFVTNDGLFDLTWRLSEAGNVVYQLTYANGHEQEPEIIEIAEEYTHTFELPIEIEGIYSLELRPIDLAGNAGEIVNETIRLNAKPLANPGPDRRVFKGGTIAFTPEVADSDGTIVEYLWDFGIGETSAEAEPTCNYQELGEYLVTLSVMDNDGKWSDPGTSKVTVTNTSCGELTLDEDWEGDADIIGDITVPPGVTLRIKAGTTIDFLGEYQMIVYGRILIEGSAEQPVIIGAETDTWGGIRLINADPGSILQYTQIYAAYVGLVSAECDLTVEDCLFAHNRIGIHLLDSAPLLKGCILQENLVYGVKEDDGAAPTVLDCSFINNLTIDYYEDELGIIGIEQLNELGQNKGNKVIN